MRILIIEDDLGWQTKYRTELPPTVEIIEVTDHETAATVVAQLVNGTTTFDAIVFDGCLYGDNFDTAPYVRILKDSGFTGPMIATSSNPSVRTWLLEAGCTYEARHKETIPRLLKKILKL